jgi:hypothetical protein
MFDNKFWVAAAERAIKTFAQTLVALMGTEMLGVHEFEWGMSLSAAAFAGLLSLVTSLASANFGANPGPSLVDESTHPETVVVEVEVPAAPKKAAAKKATSTKK